MSPEERAKWCIRQAEETEQQLPPFDADDLKPIGFYLAGWFREMAFDLLEPGSEAIQ